MRIGYTKKQAALLRLFAEGKLHRYTILSGSVRSGKTWISLVIWAFWVATRPKDGVYMMAGKTSRRSIETVYGPCKPSWDDAISNTMPRTSAGRYSGGLSISRDATMCGPRTRFVA